MANGYIAGSAPDENQPMNFYWNNAWVPIDSTTNPQDAVFYPDKSTARIACAQLQQRFPNQMVSAVPAQRTVVLQIQNAPDILPPISPNPSSSSVPPTSSEAPPNSSAP